MDLWSVEHFLAISFIKIRFSFNQNIGETLTQCKKGESNFDKKMVKKCSTDPRFTLKETTSYKTHTLMKFSIFQ